MPSMQKIRNNRHYGYLDPLSAPMVGICVAILVLKVLWGVIHRNWKIIAFPVAHVILLIALMPFESQQQMTFIGIYGGTFAILLTIYSIIRVVVIQRQRVPK